MENQDLGNFRDGEYLYPAVPQIDLWLLFMFASVGFPGIMFASYYFFNGSF